METIRASQGVAITRPGATDWFHWVIKLFEAEMLVGLGTKLRAENQGEREQVYCTLGSQILKTCEWCSTGVSYCVCVHDYISAFEVP